ncbi:MAG: hypothetical protein ACPGLV_08470 [Bacteroidia bacterium]
MHELEPFYHWRELYKAEEDERSPFFEREYSEVYFTNTIYNYVIHPQWDEFGSSTLYIKILFADYNKGFAIIEMIGEWNDCINNDVMFLKREIADILIEEGINKFVLVGENLLQFHGESEDYYEEWYDDVEEGWIVALNFRPHIHEQLAAYRIDYYINYGGELDGLNWRALNPFQLFAKVEHIISHRLT